MDEAIRRLQALGERGDIVALETEAHTLETSWRDEPDYLERVLRLCDALHSLYLADAVRLNALVRDLVLQAIERAERDSALSAARLIEHLPADPTAQRYPDDDAWWMRRSRQARAWLSGWSRLEALLDPQFDPADTPGINLDAPEGLPSGASPEAVVDAERRRAYEQLIEENRVKSERYREQITVRRMLPVFGDHAVQAVAALYRQPPPARSELETLMDDYGLVSEQRERILSALEEGR